MNGKCEYCASMGPMRVSREENPAKVDLYVCDPHWQILSEPALAVPFLKSVASEALRGRWSEDSSKKLLKSFTDVIGKWKPVPPR